jgi:UDP-N-acetylmuramoyl-tripeptide--D-alanyl-D-alanine ligase
MNLKILLNILQLEGYDPEKLIRWVSANQEKVELEGKKPLVWTTKAKLIYTIALILWPITLIAPEWGLWLAVKVVGPIDFVIKEQVKRKVRRKIDMLKAGGLRVVGISGSYGKSSVKEYLYQCLKNKYRVVRTPESYNTVLGIAKVVEMELWDDAQIFICEMGAYKTGETLEICQMVDPDYAMLTGLNEQHLERFGSVEAEILGESESIKYVLKKQGKVVVNLGDELVKGAWGGISGVIGYGVETRGPVEQNIEGAIKMAKVLGVGEKQLPKTFLPLEHRLTTIKRGKFTIIDDAYSSNTTGFRAAIDYLEKFKGWKIVVTPGIIELGKETTRIHVELGELMRGRIDQLILVGDNERTRGLYTGFGGGEYVNALSDVWSRISVQGGVVLFENDLPDNY